MQKPKTNRSILSKQIPYRSSRIRFLILLLLSLVVFSNMYSFNNPQALQNSLMQQLQISQTQFNMLYTIIALPNIIFPFFIGIIIDFVGVRIAFIVLTFSVLIFQTVVAVGAATASYHTMLIGRMFFGIAVESLSVAQTCFVSYWFLGKELAFSIGVATTFPELGNALNSAITPVIYQRTGSLGAPFFVSVGICCLSFFCSCIASYIDYIADKEDQDHNVRQVTDTELQFSEAEPQTIKLKDLKQLRKTFWLMVCLCMFSMAQYIPFLDNVNQLLQVRFCFSQVSAGKNIMVTYLVTSILGFPLGIVVDKLGFKRHLTMIGMTLFMCAHIIILICTTCTDSTLDPSWSEASWGLFLLGFAYCFYANCIVPSIPIVVSKKITGSAFGIMLVLENLAMAICPILAGQIIQSSSTKQRGYRNSSIFYAIMGIIGTLVSLLLFFISEKDKRLLDGTMQDKKVTAIQINTYFSDGENQKYNAQSGMDLEIRLIKSYSCMDYTSNSKNQKIELQRYNI